MKIFTKVKSIIPTYQKHGIDGIIYSILKNLKLNTRFVSILEKKKYYIEKRIIDLTNKEVIKGPYKSTKLTCKTHWKGFDVSSKLIGFYEQQVQEKIISLQKKFDLENLINFGCGDGYHLIGLLKNDYFKQGLAFERDQFGIDQIKENATLNNVKEKVTIFESANFKDVSKTLNDDQLKKSLFLVDIEGAEFDLFNQSNLNCFKNSILLIENHHFYAKKISVDNFFVFMKKHFNLEVLMNGSRNPYEIDQIANFDDDEKWLIASEGRKQTMDWLVFTPKNS